MGSLEACLSNSADGEQMMNMGVAILAYVGPETLVPAASVLAAVIGGLLAFGRQFFRLFCKASCYIFRR